MGDQLHGDPEGAADNLGVRPQVEFHYRVDEIPFEPTKGDIKIARQTQFDFRADADFLSSCFRYGVVGLAAVALTMHAVNKIYSIAMTPIGLGSVIFEAVVPATSGYQLEALIETNAIKKSLNEIFTGVEKYLKKATGEELTSDADQRLLKELKKVKLVSVRLCDQKTPEKALQDSDEEDESLETGDGGSEILPTTPKLRDDVRKILPSLPDSHLNAFVKELEKKYGVFSLEDDIPHVDEKELEKIEGLKGAQKAEFLEYAKQLRSPGAKEPRVIARGINTGAVTIKKQAEVRAGGSVLAEAIKAKEINVDDKAKMSADARLEETDFSNVDFISNLKSYLPMLPDKKIRELIEELEDKLGVHGATDLGKVDLKDVKALRSLKGAEMESFLEYVERVKELCNQEEPKNEPPPGMYN